MCSQECMAKMKILCLNTVQVLFKDAFDRFSSNIASRNLLLDQPESGPTAGGDHDLSGRIVCKCPETTDSCQRASTSFDDPNNNHRTCLNCSSNCPSEEYRAMMDNDQNCQNQLNNRLAGQFRGQQSGQPTNQQTNQLNSQTNQPADRRSLSQQVLCNLMQNLVDAINEQCVKQLPGQEKAEKKKRKRKRKRKKSKANEMHDEQTPNERKQMRRMESFTNEQLKPADKISADNGPSTEATCSRQSSDDQCHRQTPDSLRKSDWRPKERSKESVQCGLAPMKGDESRKGSDASRRPLSPAESSIASLARPANRAHGERCVKRKRDESPSYKERRRITSARKRPTDYKRKRLSSPSSSCSEDSSSASSTGSSSSDDELDDF